MKTITVKILRPSALALVLVGVILSVLWYYGEKLIGFDSADKSYPSVQGTSKFANETEWMVFEMVNDLAGMISYYHTPGGENYGAFSVSVKSQKLSAPYTFDVEVNLPGVSESVRKTLEIDPQKVHIWSPGIYVDFAREIMEALRTRRMDRGAIPDEQLTLLSLSHPTVETLQSENIRISKALSENMLDSFAHESAALLLGVLSLQEASGIYFDLRQNLNRMTAHLCLSLAIAPSPASRTARRLAEIIVNILIQDQAAAMDGLAAIKDKASGTSAESDMLRSWHDALYARTTRDWRTLKSKPDLNLMEKIALFRALCRSVTSTHAVTWLQTMKDHGIPRRIIANEIGHNRDGSVANGHRFFRNGIADELLALGAFCDPELLQKKRIVNFLNLRATGCIEKSLKGPATVSVISRGLWAQFFQRHLVHRIACEYDFYRNSWGQNELAEAYLEDIDDIFRGLDLYPVFRRVIAASIEDYQDAMTSAIPLFRKHPEYYTAAQWHWLNYRYQGAPIHPGIPSRGIWFATGLPPGTLYQLGFRSNALQKVRRQAETLYASAFQKAPYSHKIIDEYREHCLPKQDPSSDQIRQLYGPMVAYHLGAMDKLATAYKNQDTDAYVELMWKICDLSESFCYGLGRYLAKNNKPEAAAEAYQQAIDRSTDEVRMSNGCDWLVNYYYDTGKKERALSIAKRAAEVYSQKGLETMAKLQEKMNSLDTAEDYFQKIRERYDTKGMLCAFYQRHPNHDKFQAKYNDLIGELFPGGMQTAALSEFSGSPSNGVIFLNSNRILAQYGLGIHDIIVAIDGCKVKNLEQYVFVRSLSDSPRMDLVVWHRNHYIAVQPELENRLFGVNIATYP
jgi:tetratricopeptide (TPR) repeat protein